MAAMTSMSKTYLDHPVNKSCRTFFPSLLERVDKTALAHNLVEYLSNASFFVEDYPEVTGSYSRTIVCRLKNGFETMVARWSESTETAVHGHPDYAFYYCLVGQLEVEHFEMGDKGIVSAGTTIMHPGDYYCVEGIPGTYENGIHRICAVDESLSLHVYSDDALKGKCFFSTQDQGFCR